MDQHAISRRHFLKTLAFTAASAGLAYRFPRAWRARLNSKSPDCVQESCLLMGGVINLTLISDEPAQARAVARNALAEMKRLAGIYTRFDPSSPLSHLNAGGSLPAPDPALVGLLREALSISRASHGAFDVSVKPLYDVYSQAYNRDGQLPRAADVHAAMDCVGYERIICHENEIRFATDGMALTLDGIAKGAVVDAGVAALRASGFTDVIVEAGGDLFASGARNTGAPWQVGLRSPQESSAFSMPILGVENLAVATSGGYLQPFSPGGVAHHILDPHRGISPSELASATVIAPSTLLADALATTLMVLGVEAGLELLIQFPGCAALLIDQQGHVVSSPDMAAYLT